MKDSVILSVENLNVEIKSKGIGTKIVDDLSFDVNRGEILSIVGESGSGKSITAKAILGLLPHNCSVNGRIFFEPNETYKSFDLYSSQNKPQMVDDNISGSTLTSSVLFGNRIRGVEPLICPLQSSKNGWISSSRSRAF